MKHHLKNINPRKQPCEDDRKEVRTMTNSAGPSREVLFQETSSGIVSTSHCFCDLFGLEPNKLLSLRRPDYFAGEAKLRADC